MSDLIERDKAIDAFDMPLFNIMGRQNAERVVEYLQTVIQRIKDLPSAQPEIKPIEYCDCSNAMLRMWMDNVVTDGEYNRIMNKLNAHWGIKNG